MLPLFGFAILDISSGIVILGLRSMLPIVLIFCSLEFVLKILLRGEEVGIGLNVPNRLTLGLG